MNRPENRVRRCLVLNLAVLIATVVLEIIYFPAVATTCYGLVGGEGGPDSSMGYFRDVYVFPTGIAFVIVAAAVLALVAGRGHKALHRALIAAWVIDGIAVVGSALWYFHAIGVASGRKG